MCYLMLLRESRLTGSSEAPIELVWKLSARFGAVFKIRSNLGRVEGTGFHLRRSSWLKRELNLPGSFPFSVLKGVALTDNKMNIQDTVFSINCFFGVVGAPIRVGGASPLRGGDRRRREL